MEKSKWKIKEEIVRRLFGWKEGRDKTGKTWLFSLLLTKSQSLQNSEKTRYKKLCK